MFSKNTMDHSNWLYRGTAEIFPNQDNSNSSEGNLVNFLQDLNRPLRVKLGIDPTGNDIHLGHSIPFRKLRAFQDAGHTAVVIIGDFTAQIGDPTGKSEVRKQLSPKQVEKNVESYLEQLHPILDFNTPGRLEIRYNSEWLNKLNFHKVQELLSTMTVSQMLAKEGFSERYKKENPIFLHEFLYPLMQGYDSVIINADIELGGTDQKFNIAIGRDLQRYFGQKPQFGLLLPILTGTDGSQKMSKSLGNYIGLKEDALSMYSKTEKIPDNLVQTYFELLTDLNLNDLPKNPRECQKLLAIEITSHYHGRKKALLAQKTAESLIKNKNTLSKDNIAEYNLSEVTFPAKLFYILSASKLCVSSGEGRRQIQGGSVRLEGKKILDINIVFENPEQLTNKILQVGKTKFIKLV
ncbi:MAG: tyrosyl-tRNA synthetase [Candidatus Atelocyanobacterium thalassa isolate SIO64986]|uniref:Tyrosine--tRNA ligase n=1 Tax=Candidatus Atelocyanobacterium thalassa isolate SIO64986 TaxID=1527444 RepID=A0A086CFP3_9CHRO|nr:MAG: tyrosyl-tRNA synthetase [Candidatus Atelocyanobacterium thalassa isolate SIO64986]